MAYGVLKRLESGRKLGRCLITLSRKDTAGKREYVHGGSITSISRSRIFFAAGEAGREEFSAPLESVLEITLDGRVLFRKKKRIEKIYPRAVN